MTKPIKVDFSKTEDSSFYVPPGTYPVKCTKIEQEEGSKAPYLKFSFGVVGRSVTLVRNASLAPNALFTLKNTLAALLNRDIPKSTVSINPEKLVGLTAIAVVIDREYGGKVYSDVVRMEPYTSATSIELSTDAAPVVPVSGDPTDDLEEL